MGRRKIILQNWVATVLLAAGVLLENHVAAQQTQLSPQQWETVQQLIEGFKKNPRRFCLAEFAVENKEGLTAPQVIGIIENAVKNIDPILVGKHVVFSKDWLKVIGNDYTKQVTRQQFQTWVWQHDRMFEYCEEFMGQKPLKGTKVFIDLRLKSEIMKSLQSSYAHAHHSTPVICYNFDHKRFGSFLREIRLQGTITYVAMHEMAHIFTSLLPWDAESEVVAALLQSYAMEKGGFEYGSPMRSGLIHQKTKGSQHRLNWLDKALIKLKENKIEPFSKGFGEAYEYGSAYELYMLGLVAKVGWDTMKKAVQSYHNNTYTPTKNYEGSNRSNPTGSDARRATAHEFFDRVAYFHDVARSDPGLSRNIPEAGIYLTGATVLRSLPDGGKFLDEHFTVKTTPIQGTPIDEGTISTAPSPPVQSTQVPTRPVRSFVNEELQQLNSSETK